MADAATLDAIRITLDPGARAALPVILGVIMFSVALTLRVEDFAFLKSQPLRFLGAAAAQVLALPCATLLLILALDPLPSIALGMIVVACCPGGNVSNFFTHLARGDAAFSVSLTATSSLGAALLTPISIFFWASVYPPTSALITEIDVQPAPFLIQTTTILAIPLALGMALAHAAPAIAARIRPALSGLSLAALVAICIVGLQGNWALFLTAGAATLPIVVAHNAMAFLLGAAWGRMLAFGPARRRSMTFEVGIQNSGLGLVILLGQFEGLGGAAAITALWGVWHLISGLALSGGFRALDAVQARAKPRSAQ